MKKVMFLTGFLFSTALFAANDCGVAVINADNTRVRVMPSLNAKVTKSLARSSEVCVYDVRNNYALINKNGSNWVSMDLLNFVAETKLAVN